MSTLALPTPTTPDRFLHEPEVCPAPEVRLWRCCFCRYELSDADSQRRGYGPDCERSRGLRRLEANDPEAYALLRDAAIALQDGRTAEAFVFINRLEALGRYQKAVEQFRHTNVDVRMWRMPDGTFRVRTRPYSEDFRLACRCLGMRWSGPDKAWAFTESQAEGVLAALLLCYPNTGALGANGVYQVLGQEKE